jgi:hypothetical protein
MSPSALTRALGVPPAFWRFEPHSESDTKTAAKVAPQKSPAREGGSTAGPIGALALEGKQTRHRTQHDERRIVPLSTAWRPPSRPNGRSDFEWLREGGAQKFRTPEETAGLPPPHKCSVGPVDLGRGVNLFAVRIENTHRDGARRPIRVDDKRDGARDASCVGAPFPKDVGRTVKELDSVLHVPSSRRSVATLEHPRDRYRTPTPLVPHPRRSAATKLEALDSGEARSAG